MMVRDSAGTLRTVSAIRVRDAANALRTVAAISVRDTANVLRTVTGFSFTAVASPNTLYGFGRRSGSIQITVSSATVTVTDSAGPFTYLWECDDVDWAPISPTAQTTSFRSPLLNSGDVSNTIARCTVTSGATSSISNGISLTAENLG